ncbi:recombinase family protein [Streptomyces albipurpureus]|uniref:Recombinase family protein n=1 Tax=Streptomyces albipurpureus TaxID=2897419 RepID=A0ABT0V2G7_9ACTN|nr:recombinase family protein [Streptomyces sp. CWNU-1]MCM2394075.1 recombinase family protein [Streptomyces sp. CWNU-1]
MPAPRAERPVRIGYARTSAARRELASQLEALRRAECHKVFSERISTRVKVRPELEKALALARQFKGAAPDPPHPAAVATTGEEVCGLTSAGWRRAVVEVWVFQVERCGGLRWLGGW